jgi:pimeloyl-ACP methyl ester carboxylesterase
MSSLVNDSLPRLRCRRLGQGPPVGLLPSLGRPASDFERLATALAQHGYEALLVDLPGVAGSPLLPPDADLHDLAQAVAHTMAAQQSRPGPFFLVGHAFGNRVARCLAADQPTSIRGLVLLGCGGLVPGDPEALAALLACFDLGLDPGRHHQAVATAFFAPGNDATCWATGWHPMAAAAQRAALERVRVEAWWLPPPPIPVLAMVGHQDRIAPPANAEALVADLGPRGEPVIVDGAGHALLPEQPTQVEAAILAWLARHA